MTVATVCEAMRKAGITDGLKAEHFCAFECPYKKCVLTKDKPAVLRSLKGK